MFIQLKTAFGIYGKVGGALIFALVLDVATRMFFLACQVLFRHESFVSPFIFAMTTFQAVKKILALLTIAELGHQLAAKVEIKTWVAMFQFYYT